MISKRVQRSTQWLVHGSPSGSIGLPEAVHQVIQGGDPCYTQGVNCADCWSPAPVEVECFHTQDGWGRLKAVQLWRTQSPTRQTQ